MIEYSYVVGSVVENFLSVKSCGTFTGLETPMAATNRNAFLWQFRHIALPEGFAVRMRL